MAGIPIEFVLFGLTLLGVALLHHRTLEVAAAGLAAITLYKLAFGSFRGAAGLEGLAAHLSHEWVIVANLGCLLLGFALLSRHFEKSHVPLALPHVLPDDWRGAFLLLVIVFVLSSFLDNIAGALIGGTMAHSLFKRLHIGYLAAIVAASNAGGAGSVIGDTTTTMMWIAGVPPATYADSFPFIGVAVLVVILLSAPIRRPDWHLLDEASRGAAFLLALVVAASMMPVEQLPAASWQTAFGMGFVSAVFDNIPLTKLALDQGGYDWGVLAYCVGFGGSMIWFGSSSGVALSNLFPQARSVGGWIRHGWHVPVAYVVGFFVMLALLGWVPTSSQ